MKQRLRLVVNNQESRDDTVNYEEFRTPIGKLCLKLTPKTKSPKEDAELRGVFGKLCASILGPYKEPKAEAFGVVKGSLESGCQDLYSFFSGLLPRGKSPSAEAEETLLKSGWTQEKIQQVRLLEQQM